MHEYVIPPSKPFAIDKMWKVTHIFGRGEDYLSTILRELEFAINFIHFSWMPHQTNFVPP